MDKMKNKKNTTVGTIAKYNKFAGVYTLEVHYVACA
jgi:hypothetical protein